MESGDLADIDDTAVLFFVFKVNTEDVYIILIHVFLNSFKKDVQSSAYISFWKLSCDQVEKLNIAEPNSFIFGHEDQLYVGLQSTNV